jgi:hypothetical protein
MDGECLIMLNHREDRIAYGVRINQAAMIDPDRLVCTSRVPKNTELLPIEFQ